MRLLHRIFCGVIVAKDRSCGPKQMLIVTANDEFEKRILAPRTRVTISSSGESLYSFC
jgi:hypothetical protein